jgi:aspartate racemase
MEKIHPYKKEWLLRMNLQVKEKKEKVVGLLGGMGPEATIDIFQKIVQATDANKDEDHLRIIIDNNPKMPSRQDAILKGTENPGPMMSEIARNLEKAGSDFIIICANTAHYFYDYVKEAVEIDVLHIINETVNETQRLNKHIKKVGVLATTGAMQVNIFQDSFSQKDVEVVEVPIHLQNRIQEAIFSFKYKGRDVEIVDTLMEAMDYFIQNGAEAIVMGCTEIPLILGNPNISVPLLDPNEIIAKVAVNFAKEK